MSKPLSFTMKSLDGKDVDLSKYQGKVVVFVNVASKCGLTPQYDQLQALHEKYAEDGLAVLRIGGQLIVPEAHPRTAARCAPYLDRILEVPVDELARAEGAVTCCSILIETES